MKILIFLICAIVIATTFNQVDAETIISVEEMDKIIEHLERFNNTNDLTLIITFLLFAVVVGGNLISYIFLSKQIKQTQKEFLHKIRPIIARHVYDKQIFDKSQVNGDTYSLMNTKVMFHIINNGTSSAVKVRKKSYVETNEKLFDKPKLDTNDNNNLEVLPDLAPTEYYSVDICWKYSDYVNSTSNTNCYFGLLIWYYDDDNNRYYYHIEGHFDKKSNVKLC